MIHRGRSGFGFSISGESPVIVCRVDDGSLAALSGLKVNDVLWAVDGHNVATAASETVAALVRYIFVFVSFVGQQKHNELESTQRVQTLPGANQPTRVITIRGGSNKIKKYK